MGLRSKLEEPVLAVKLGCSKVLIIGDQPCHCPHRQDPDQGLDPETWSLQGHSISSIF
jgi:hypothetical protein